MQVSGGGYFLKEESWTILGIIKVVWLETQGSVWEVTQNQGEGQGPIPFGLFKYILHSLFLSHRDVNAS